MKTTILLGSIAALALTFAPAARATDFNVEFTLNIGTGTAGTSASVVPTLNFKGHNYFDSGVAESPGVTLQYYEDPSWTGYGSAGGVFLQQLNRPLAYWAWVNGPAESQSWQMDLTEKNALSLYSDGGGASIVLTPSYGATAASIKINDSPVLTQPAGDARYLKSIGTTLVFGTGSTATGSNAIALGAGAHATAAAATALGSGASASGAAATALGAGTTASGAGSLAGGSLAMASGIGATALGYFTTASGENGSALGRGSIASGLWGATAMGCGAVASGDISTAMGWSTVASGGAATAMGYGTRATGYSSTAIGQSTTASSQAATAMGYYTQAFGWGSLASGDHAQSHGHLSLSLGAYTDSIGEASSAFGVSSRAEGYASSAFGRFTVAQGTAQFVIGQFNTPVGTETGYETLEPVFIIGNGTNDSTRSNALLVRRNGDAILSNNLTVNQNVAVKGILRVPAAGDLSMGEFTNGPQP